MTAPTITRRPLPRVVRTVRYGVRRHPDGQPVRAVPTLDLDAALEQKRAACIRAYHAGLVRAATERAILGTLGQGWEERAQAEARAIRAARRAEMERRIHERRAEQNIAVGRHPDWQYRGQAAGGSGAVCWESGYPVETANAWLSRPRWMPIPTTVARWIPAQVEVPSNVTQLRPRAVVDAGLGRAA